MANSDKDSDRNKNIDGYKVEGDGNAENVTNPPIPENRTFEENPDKMKSKSESDIPGKEFNINDKAYFESSKSDFVKTVSNMHHADEDFLTTDTNNKD
ncbi:hypothetical protein [Flavobacterium sp. 3HN19-14]|uniref:hypothetical protein n=1 Tax=Flavobacterium sp. 3HN19-14 TaxID=3448133 RepID=UPI003EDF7E1B